MLTLRFLPIVVTKLKLRAYRYPQDIWGGSIIVPRSKEREVAEAIAAMDKSEDVEHRVFALLLMMPDVFVVNAFDANGEKHGRKTFAPVLNIDGAIDTTKIMNLSGFAGMQAPAEFGKGVKQVWWNPLALEQDQLSKELLLKSFRWQTNHIANGVDASVMYELWGTVSDDTHLLLPSHPSSRTPLHATPAFRCQANDKTY